jgi:hypothetical protein
MTSDAKNAASVAPSGQPEKYPRHKKNTRANGAKAIT